MLKLNLLGFFLENVHVNFLQYIFMQIDGTQLSVVYFLKWFYNLFSKIFSYLRQSKELKVPYVAKFILS